MAQPVWVTAAGDLGTIAENLFFQLSLVATDPDGGTPTYSLIAGRLPEGYLLYTSPSPRDRQKSRMPSSA